jgi:hypothetical protein
MAIGLIKGNTLVAVTAEVTEGTFVEATAADDYIQPLSDGLELNFAKDLKSRDNLNSSIGKSRARVGIKSAAATIPVEVIGGGSEGAKPDWDLLIKAALGTESQLAARVTTKGAGNTDQILQLEDSDIGDFAVNDVILVLEAGDHFLSPVIAVDPTGGAANITLLRTRAAGAFSASVEISKNTKYTPANAGHPTLSTSVYWGDEIRSSGHGMRPTSMALENFSTGELASLNFGLEGIAFDEIDGSAPVTPTFTSALPPLILEACVYQDGTQIDVNEVSIEVSNSIGFITSTCSSDGRISSRLTERNISGSFNPYKDDTSVAQFTRFNNNTQFSLFFFAANPSAVAGEYELGSIVCFWLPSAIINEKPVGDIDGILTEEIAFIADRGEQGTTDDIVVVTI